MHEYTDETTTVDTCDDSPDRGQMQQLQGMFIIGLERDLPSR